jgi:hypothetical protein
MAIEPLAMVVTHKALAFLAQVELYEKSLHQFWDNSYE